MITVLEALTSAGHTEQIGGLSYLKQDVGIVWYPSWGLFSPRGVLVSGYGVENGTPFGALPNTQAKLDAAQARLRRRCLPAAPVLCSDTTVALGRRIHGKPLDAADAADTLRQLSGRTHRVITAVAVGLGQAQRLAVSESRVSFGEIDEAALKRYVAGGEPFGKAGAYAIQGAASVWVSRIAGSYSGIMGLPLYETAQLLRAFGVRC
jgi:septum formation protein